MLMMGYDKNISPSVGLMDEFVNIISGFYR